MQSNELAIKFTENRYATKNEVSKELKMSMIDTIWSNILSYRSNFNHYLTIKTVDNTRLLLCQCPTIAGKVNNIEAKLLAVLSDYSRLDFKNKELSRFNEWCLAKSLTSVARKHDLDADSSLIKAVANDDSIQLSLNNKILIRYKNALAYIKDYYVNNIDYDFIKQLYAILSGSDARFVGYRNVEDNSLTNKAIVNRVYTSAPVNSISSMMNSLFSFIENSNLGKLTKALISYFYVDYIKPFADFNDEIALLIAKSVLAHNKFDEFGATIPLEDLLSEDIDNISRVLFEVQKTRDTTYFVDYALTYINKVVQSLADEIINCKKVSLEEDFYQQEEVMENVSNALEETKPVQEIETSESKIEPIKEEPKPIIQQKVEQTPKQIVEPIKSTPVEPQLAVGYIPPAIDEKQAGRLERYLLESDPNLKRGEAKFYARHCTLGMIYTIAQYKKAIGCVYETARTSMDHLAELGYYKKDIFKNKFVYTPVDRK